MTLATTPVSPLPVALGPGGTVWARTDAEPRDTGLSPGAFAAAADGPVRVLAAPDNAALLLALARRAGPDAPPAEVGRPADVPWDDLRRAGPRAVLAAMRSSAIHPALGGWRPIARRDAAVYAMAVAAAAPGGRPADHLAGHPAYPALRFVAGLDPDAAARLCAAVLDPRYFADPDRPDRPGRLLAYLGLVEARTLARAARRALVRAAWNGPGPVDPAAPGAFLRRGGDEARGSRRFVAYLRGTWLDATTDRRRCGDGLFAPEHFFAGEPATAAAFRRAVPPGLDPAADAA